MLPEKERYDEHNRYNENGDDKGRFPPLRNALRQSNEQEQSSRGKEKGTNPVNTRHFRLNRIVISGLRLGNDEECSYADEKGSSCYYVEDNFPVRPFCDDTALNKLSVELRRAIGRTNQNISNDLSCWSAS